MPQFDYTTAFSRNIGWLSPEEQSLLRAKKVAIAGMGGVGGVHLLTLMRLGIGHVHIADFDEFDVANFNRQAGAFMSTVGKKKAQVMHDMAKDINPTAEIKVFENGVTDNNLDSFLEGVDLYIDGLDFFVLEEREKVFKRAYELDIPCTSVAPIGLGASLINIMPGKMSFEEYFGLSGAKTDIEKALRFGLGMSPGLPHKKSVIEEESFDFINKKAPSTPMGCQLASGVAISEAVKILLKRGKVICAPRTVHFDAYTNSIVKSWVPFGFKNPWHRFKLWLARKVYAPKKKTSYLNQET